MRRFSRISSVICLSGLLTGSLVAQPTEAKLHDLLQRFHAESRFPGAVLAVWRPGSDPVVAAVGLADRERKTPMTSRALLHAGSAGKMIFAALALDMVAHRRMTLDDRVARYLGGEPWYSRLPNGDSITVRMLLNHTSGLPEYGSDFMGALIDKPGERRTPLDAVKSVLGEKPKHAAGSAFAYSDVNYQVLQLMMERIMGGSAYQAIGRLLLEPNGFAGIVPTDRKLIPGLVQGYAGEKSFMGFDAVLGDSGFKLDPAFEGGGGGFATTAGDLARWMGLFMLGQVFSADLMPEVVRGVPAGQMDVGKEALSGLGVEIVETPLGKAYGHGGFFPGYLTLVLWYEGPKLAVAIQVNSSAGDALARPLREVLLEAARMSTSP